MNSISHGMPKFATPSFLTSSDAHRYICSIRSERGMKGEISVLLISLLAQQVTRRRREAAAETASGLAHARGVAIRLTDAMSDASKTLEASLAVSGYSGSPRARPWRPPRGAPGRKARRAGKSQSGSRGCRRGMDAPHT